MMSMVKEKLPTMYDLARDRSEPARIELAGMLADIFLNPDAVLSLREEEMANELIDQLLLTGSAAVRSQLVHKFADMSRMPARIAKALARDSIDVAGPVLLASACLADDDLIQVIDMKGGDHALAVASRAEISAAVADALVTTGDMRVMIAVAENLGAHLTYRAVDVLADAARYAAPLRAPVMRRPELTPDAAMKLYWWVEQDLRRYALQRFGFNAGQIDRALGDTVAAFLGDHAHEKDNDAVMAQVADWMEAHDALTPQVLPQVLRMGHFRLFNMLLSRLSGLTVSLTDTIMDEVGGRGLAAICRTIGIDKPGFVSLFLLARGGRPGEHIVHPRELAQALAAFDRLSPAIAGDLLRSWKANPDYFARHMQETSAEIRAQV